MGFDQSDQAGALRTYGGTAVWGFYFKPCNAMGIEGTERVLVENWVGKVVERGAGASFLAVPQTPPTI